MINIMDAVTLIRTALDERHYGPLQRCAAVSQTWDGGMHLLREFGKLLLPKGMAKGALAEPDEQTVAEWRIRFFEAAARLREAGMQRWRTRWRGRRSTWRCGRSGTARARLCAYLAQPPIDEAARKRSTSRAARTAGRRPYQPPEPVSAEKMRRQQKRAGRSYVMHGGVSGGGGEFGFAAGVLSVGPEGGDHARGEDREDGAEQVEVEVFAQPRFEPPAVSIFTPTTTSTTARATLR
jgi:hypothetical protein